MGSFTRSNALLNKSIETDTALLSYKIRIFWGVEIGSVMEMCIALMSVTLDIPLDCRFKSHLDHYDAHKIDLI